MGNRILVAGKDGRAHALGWKIIQSPTVEKVYFAPGNGGTGEIGENLDVKSNDFETLARHVEKEGIDLTLFSSEDPYAEGGVDFFRARGLRVFGSTQEASRLESSKIFSDVLKQRYNIPTPLPSEPFYKGQMVEATTFLLGNWRDDRKFVVKADGLATGKGVIVCDSYEEAVNAVERFMEKKELKEAGENILIQRRLDGWELSSIGLTDGKTYLPFDDSQDNKRVGETKEVRKFDRIPFDQLDHIVMIGEGDVGRNTGGMGAYSPVPQATPELKKTIREKIMLPTIQAMNKEGIPYQGALYAGLIIVNENGIEVPVDLEYNIRFGDPETEPVMVRLKSDLVPYLFACTDGTLDRLPPLEWDDRWAVTVALVSGGYPGNYETNKLITGLEEVKKMKDVFVFHGGTKKVQDGKLVTDGGRVIYVTALDNGAQAIERVYAAIESISFDKMYFRRDIGRRVLEYLKMH